MQVDVMFEFAWQWMGYNGRQIEVVVCAALANRICTAEGKLMSLCMYSSGNGQNNGRKTEESLCLCVLGWIK